MLAYLIKNSHNTFIFQEKGLRSICENFDIVLGHDYDILLYKIDFI